MTVVVSSGEYSKGQVDGAEVSIDDRARDCGSQLNRSNSRDVFTLVYNT